MNWKCRDGRIIPVSKMSDGHLANTIAMLRRLQLDGTKQFAAMSEELSRRNSMIQDILGEKFYKQHKVLLALAFRNEIALCGSVAACLVSGRVDREPKDIDMVCGCPDVAANFMWDLMHFMSGVKGGLRIMFNSNSDRLPDACRAHYRIQAPFWKPVCLFVLRERKDFHSYRIKGGAIVQRTIDIKKAAEELVARDGKDRVAAKINETQSIPIYEVFSSENPFKKWDDLDVCDPSAWPEAPDDGGSIQ